MRDIKDLPAWERLFKKIVWKQLEMRVSEIDEFVRIAFFHHLIIRKRELRIRKQF